MALHNDFPSLLHDHQFNHVTIPNTTRVDLLVGNAKDTAVFSILASNPNASVTRLRIGLQRAAVAADVIWFFDSNLPINAGNVLDVSPVEGLRSHPKLMTSPNGDRYLALPSGYTLVAEAPVAPATPLRLTVTAMNYDRS